MSDNIIQLDLNRTTKGEVSVEDVVREMINNAPSDRAVLFSMSDDGLISVSVAGEFMNSELVLLAEVLKDHAMSGVIYGE